MTFSCRRFGEDTISNRILSSNSSLRVLVLGGEAFPTKHSLAQWWSPASHCRIFNIYGTTEVSCWATLHEVQRQEIDGSSTNQPIPLGSALDETEQSVRDIDTGLEVSQGVGELFIGSASRCCVVNDETEPPALRTTGDLVERTVTTQGDVRLVWLSRKDRRIKRFGQWVNLDVTSSLIQLAMPHWSAVMVTSDQHEDQARLLCFFTTQGNSAVSPIIIHDATGMVLFYLA